MVENVAHIRGLTGQQLINSTDWTAAKVGSANLPERKWLLIQNKSNVRVAFTTDNTKVYKECPEIGKGEQVVLPVGGEITIYVKAQSSVYKRVVIMELA